MQKSQILDNNKAVRMASKISPLVKPLQKYTKFSGYGKYINGLVAQTQNPTVTLPT